MPTVPMTPSGSRTKILISSQVSVSSPRSIGSLSSESSGRSLEEDVFERRTFGAEIGHLYSMLRDTLDDPRSPNPRRVREW